MDDQIEPVRPAPTRRRFKLTPLPGAPDEADQRHDKAGLRRKLLIGGSVIPFVMTIHGRPAFATKKACTVSVILSHRNSTPLGGGGKKGDLGPCGMPSNGNGQDNWQTQYTTLTNAYITGKETYQQCLPGQVTGNNYLINPTITASFPFTLPAAANGVSFSLQNSGVKFSGALQGGGQGVVLVVTVTTGPVPPGSNSQTQNDGGGQFYQQAISALLNAALYGSSAFGYSDAQLITYVNSVFAAMQSRAGTLKAEGQNANQIMNAIFNGPTGFINGPSSVTTALQNLNNQGTG